MGLPPALTPADIEALKIHVEVLDLAPPEGPLDIPGKQAENYFRWFYDFFRHKLGAPAWLSYLGSMIAASPMLAVSGLTHGIVLLFPFVATTLAAPILEVVDGLRKKLDPTVGAFSVTVLNEILGTEFQVGDLAAGEDVASHISRAEKVGGLFHQQLLAEFVGKADVTEELGRRAAARMTGFLVNFGVATGLLGLLGEIATLGFISEFREVGVEVARNLGLGRMHRMVMKPLFTTLIATPYQWYLNRTVHPKRFTAAESINAFTGTLVDEDVLFKDLELDGWSPDRIKQLIRLHSKKLDKTQVELLVRYKAWSRELGIDYLKKLSWSAENAELVLNVAELERADKRLTAFIDSLEKDVVDGLLTIPEMEAVLDKLPLGDVEKAFISSTVSYKALIPRAQITLVQMEQAFEQGLVDLVEFDAYLRRRGYSRDDATILTQLTLLKLGQLKEKKKEADARRARKHATEAALAAQAAKKKPPA